MVTQKRLFGLPAEITSETFVAADNGKGDEEELNAIVWQAARELSDIAIFRMGGDPRQREQRWQQGK